MSIQQVSQQKMIIKAQPPTIFPQFLLMVVMVGLTNFIIAYMKVVVEGHYGCFHILTTGNMLL